MPDITYLPAIFAQPSITSTNHNHITHHTSPPIITMLFQFVSVLLIIGSDVAAAEVVDRKRTALLQHKSTNNNQQHDGYSAYIGLAQEDNVITKRQLQNSMSMSISWTEEEADGVMWNDKNEVAWKEEVDCDCKDLRLTTADIRETDDFSAQCLMEYGSNATVADWTYDLLSFNGDQIKSLIMSLGIEESFNTKHYFVTNQGQKYWDDSSSWDDSFSLDDSFSWDDFGLRVYFFEDHGGSPPSNWGVHDQLGDITLGSWYNISGQVLCTVCVADDYCLPDDFFDDTMKKIFDDTSSSGYIGLSYVSLCFVVLAIVL